MILKSLFMQTMKINKLTHSLSSLQVDLIYISIFICNSLWLQLIFGLHFSISIGLPFLAMVLFIILIYFLIRNKVHSLKTQKTDGQSFLIGEASTGNIFCSTWLGRPIIVIPNWVQRSSSFDLQFAHEITHIKRNDIRFFFYILPIFISQLLISAGVLVTMPLDNQVVDTTIAYVMFESSRSKSTFPFSYVFFSFSVFIILLNFLFLILSAREREILCDRATLRKVGAAYEAYMLDLVALERIEKISFFSRITKFFTHPSAHIRWKSLTHERCVVHDVSFFSGFLLSANSIFFTICGIFFDMHVVSQLDTMSWRIFFSKMGFAAHELVIFSFVPPLILIVIASGYWSRYAYCVVFSQSVVQVAFFFVGLCSVPLIVGSASSTYVVNNPMLYLTSGNVLFLVAIWYLVRCTGVSRADNMVVHVFVGCLATGIGAAFGVFYR